MNTAAKTGRQRQAFTLVELLVVITIIGIIAGLALPAIGSILRSARVSAMKTEMANLEQAVEAYKTKYGDYPPDFSNWPVVRRHYLKIFPDIDINELNVLYALCDSAGDATPAQTDSVADPFYGANNVFDNTSMTWLGPVMDRAEALVWALGGFSSDPKHPFTGTGGPLQLIPGATDATNPANYHYNTDRSNALIEFEPSRLSLQPFDPSAGAITYANRTRSNDEPTAQWGGVAAPVHFQPDLFPTYQLYKDSRPAVYFDARTYAHADVLGTVTAPHYVLNGFATYVDSNSDLDGIRPAFSTTPNSTSTTSFATFLGSLNYWKFANANTFQIWGPGLDGRYSGVCDLSPSGAPSDPSDNTPMYFQFPTGKVLRPQINAGNANDVILGGVDRFDLTGQQFNQKVNYTTDNMATFSDRTFEDELP